MKKHEITLILTPLLFYSTFDEDVFFEWLNKITCIKSYKGIGEALHIYITSNRISKKHIWEFKALFRRYNYNLDQLKIFKNYDPNKAIIDEQESYYF